MKNKVLLFAHVCKISCEKCFLLNAQFKSINVSKFLNCIDSKLVKKFDIKI